MDNKKFKHFSFEFFAQLPSLCNRMQIHLEMILQSFYMDFSEKILSESKVSLVLIFERAFLPKCGDIPPCHI